MRAHNGSRRGQADGLGGITARARRCGMAGLSTVELMIVGAVLGSLATLGTLAYQAYLSDVRQTLSKQQNDHRGTGR